MQNTRATSFCANCWHDTSGNNTGLKISCNSKNLEVEKRRKSSVNHRYVKTSSDVTCIMYTNKSVLTRQQLWAAEVPISFSAALGPGGSGCLAGLIDVLLVHRGCREAYCRTSLYALDAIEEKLSFSVIIISKTHESKKKSVTPAARHMACADACRECICGELGAVSAKYRLISTRSDGGQLSRQS